jgi:hypothetical protein
VHPQGPGGEEAPHRHAEHHRHQDQGEDLEEFAGLQADARAVVQEHRIGQPHHDRQREDGEYRVHRRQRDVQCDIAARDMAEQIRRRAAG